MDENPLDSMHGRCVAALLAVSDLDALQQVYVSNPVADTAPKFQRSMIGLIGAERQRRETGDRESVEVPVFETWESADLLRAGMLAITAGETAALTGDAGLINFAFRLLQLWFVAEGRRFVEEPTNA